MQERDIANKKCVPCEGGTPPLSREDVQELLFQLHREWSIRPPFEQDTTGAGREISRVFVFENFPQAISFVNKVAELAEQEGHHPDLTIRYNQVKILLSTHAIGGLSQNDFIMASKIDLL
ncbi:MAG: 4a-hydroxytetrahydrobiopterin dehydratase [Candidatus Wildermuthbacteria bacterium]|nr:4a-hydroxytetrahydrobiopterin dehydratase [Candidatus Wildermuthbacteria bacterium]